MDLNKKYAIVSAFVLVLVLAGLYLSFGRKATPETKTNETASSQPTSSEGVVLGEKQAMYEAETKEEYTKRRQGSMPTWPALEATFTKAALGKASLYYGEAAILKEKTVTVAGVTFVAAVTVAANDGQYYLEYHSFRNDMHLRFWSPLPMPQLPPLGIAERPTNPDYIAWAERVIDGTETTDPETKATRDAILKLIEATSPTWVQDK
jgi:hypothetical protein